MITDEDEENQVKEVRKWSLVADMPAAAAQSAFKFPSAFHSYGKRQGFAQQQQQPKQQAQYTESKEPAGTLIQTVRKVFYNSDKGPSAAATADSLTIKAPTPHTVPSTKGPPYSPKTPTYYDIPVDK